MRRRVRAAGGVVEAAASGAVAVSVDQTVPFVGNKGTEILIES